jgi:hypothetical protein
MDVRVPRMGPKVGFTGEERGYTVLGKATPSSALEEDR